MAQAVNDLKEQDSVQACLKLQSDGQHTIFSDFRSGLETWDTIVSNDL